MSSVLPFSSAEKGFCFGQGMFKKNQSYSWDPDLEETPHLLVWGSSGSGKSFLLREIITYLQSRNKHVHLVDLHGDLETPGDNTMQFGGYKTEHFGINPFQFDTSINAGPKTQLPIIVSMFRSTYLSGMGGIQELILKQLCSDVYLLAGIDKQDPATWMVSDIEEKTPNLEDLLALIEQIIEHYNGPKSLHKYIDSELFNLKTLAKQHGEGHDLVNKQHDDIVKNISQYIHNHYIASSNAKSEELFPIKSIDPAINLSAYEGKKALSTLESIAMYTKALIQCDIFHSTPPPVKTGSVNRYNLQYIEDEVRTFFVEALVSKIFRAAQVRGEYNKRVNPNRGEKVDTYIILDEIQSIMPRNNLDKNLPSQTYNRIASEARKYGLGLIVLTQSPGSFPTPMLSNITKRVGLKTNPIDINDAKRKLGVSDSALFNHLQVPQTAIVSNRSGGYDPVNVKR